MVEKAGGNVTIAESPGGPYNTAALKGVYSVCGVDKAIEGTNAKLNFDTSFTEVHFPEGKTVKKIPIINPILKCRCYNFTAETENSRNDELYSGR